MFLKEMVDLLSSPWKLQGQVCASHHPSLPCQALQVCTSFFSRVVRSEVRLRLEPCIPEHLFLALSWDVERKHGTNEHFRLSVRGPDLSRGTQRNAQGCLAVSVSWAGKELLAVPADPPAALRGLQSPVSLPGAGLGGAV